MPSSKSARPLRRGRLIKQALAFALAFAAACAAAQPPGKAPAPPADGAPPETNKSASPPKDFAGQSVRIKESSRKIYFQRIRGVNLDFPKDIQLKSGSADLSAVIELFKRASETDYDNFSELESISSGLLRREIDALCRKAANPEKCSDKASDDLKSALDEIQNGMSGRILYPELYFPALEKIRDEEIRHAFLRLDSECAENCRHGTLAAVMLQASSEDWQKLREKAGAADKKCQENLLDEMAWQLSHAEFPAPCLETENKSHKVCENMLKNIERIRGRISDLMELAYGPEALFETEAAAPCIDCAVKAESDGAQNPLKDLARFLEEKPQCLDLDPGGEKTVRSGNGLGHSYILKRDPDGGYSIDFPVEFSVDEDYDGEASKEDAPEHYRQRVQGCLAEASPMMLGPKGEKLKISISEPPSGAAGSCQNGQLPNRIAIGPKDYRSNSGKYEADIDCPTIVHEILHLSGLCDEYKERESGFYTDPETGKVAGANFGKAKDEDLEFSGLDFKPAYDCRPLSSNSIMSNPYERWRNVKSGKNKSLLTNGQFKSLLYGSCPAKNRRFNGCSRLAYQSSQTSEEGCLAAKSRCESENALGLDRREEEAALQNQIQELEAVKKHISDTIKSFRDQGSLNQTNQELHEKILKSLEDDIKSKKGLLSQASSPAEKAQREQELKGLIEAQDRALQTYKKAKEMGILDVTLGERYNRQLEDFDKEIQDARARLKTVQSWPES